MQHRRRRSPRPEAQQACFAYISGAIHFYGALVSAGGRFKPIVCPGRELAELTRQEVPKYMDELPAESIVRATMAEYPCPQDHRSN